MIVRIIIENNLKIISINELIKHISAIFASLMEYLLIISNPNIMTTIEGIIKKRELDYLIFKPEKSFYQKVGINQKRWGQIYRGDVPPNIIELKSIAAFFEVDIRELVL